MLSYLKITNYALIESSEIEFDGGFTVVTGESGAGKSIMMSALELLCGGRGGKDGIRTGCDRCTVSGIFSVPENLRAELRALLADGGIEFDEPLETVGLRRVITNSGTRNFIEDTPVSVRLLSDVGARLVDLHGANEQISLTVPSRQLELLDHFAALHDMRRKCAEICAEISALDDEVEKFSEALPDEAEADRLQLMVDEISHIDPQPDEDEELAGRQRRGANSRQIIENSLAMSNMLTESEDSIADRLGTVCHMLYDLERIDRILTGELTVRCETLQSDIAAISGDIANLADKVELDQEALAAVESRLSEIYTLKRRYGPTLEQLLQNRDNAEKQLEIFHAAAGKRAEFASRRQALECSLAQAARNLSDARKKKADEFLALAVEKLNSIGFNDAVLKAEFTEVAPGVSGMDRLELMFSANRGEDVRPLRKIASSGELSRLMLALKTVLADADSVPTIVFDEIDMNIGGETANRVGDELYDLGRKHQILCISHLAQVAARADEHFKVEKFTEGERTFSAVRKLDDPAPELARMLGGGESALRHAAELLRNIKK